MFSSHFHLNLNFMEKFDDNFDLCGIVIAKMKLLKHVDVNLKPQFLIESGYYVVPSLEWF